MCRHVAECRQHRLFTVESGTASTAESMLSPVDSVRLSEIIQGFASPVRLRILSAVMYSPLTVGELCEAVGAGQTAVSNHLKLLRELGLVAGTRDGRNIRYELFNSDVLQLLADMISHLTPNSTDD